ncbi:MAG: sulfite exporter TauE/SafE family protein, partial [Bacteroidota bacterium]
MTLINFLLLILGGFIAGCINVLAGGGSLLTLPLLIFMGLPTSVANATNRVAIFSQNIFAVAGFKSKGVSAYPYSLYLGLSAALGATIGATISVDLEDALFNRIIAVVMVMVIVLTVVKPKTKSSGENEKMSKKAQLIGIISFFFVGIYGG